MCIICFDHIYSKSYPSDFSLTSPTFPSQHNRLSFSFFKIFIGSTWCYLYVHGNWSISSFSGTTFLQKTSPAAITCQQLLRYGQDFMSHSHIYAGSLAGLILCKHCSCRPSSCEFMSGKYHFTDDVYFLWLLQLFSPFF